MQSINFAQRLNVYYWKLLQRMVPDIVSVLCIRVYAYSPPLAQQRHMDNIPSITESKLHITLDHYLCRKQLQCISSRAWLRLHSHNYKHIYYNLPLKKIAYLVTRKYYGIKTLQSFCFHQNIRHQAPHAVSRMHLRYLVRSIVRLITLFRPTQTPTKVPPPWNWTCSAYRCVSFGAVRNSQFHRDASTIHNIDTRFVILLLSYR